MTPQHLIESEISEGMRRTCNLDFMWVELTNTCNLECTHCYADSGPRTGARDLLTHSDYTSVLREAFGLGCRKVQFIGGEPTLNRHLPEYIELAAQLGYSFVEVFTNLVSLSESLLEQFVENQVRIATSLYSWKPDLHDAVTCRSGSHVRTTRNLRRAVAAGLETRAGIVTFDDDPGDLDRTVEFLSAIGVKSVSSDRVRSFGRAHSDAAQPQQMEELCGRCAHGTLCICSDGRVAPCIMSRQWSIGNIPESALSDVVSGTALRDTRDSIAAASELRLGCDPDCGPNRCEPNQTDCDPNRCQPASDCTPLYCNPDGR